MSYWQRLLLLSASPSFSLLLSPSLSFWRHHEEHLQDKNSNILVRESSASMDSNNHQRFDGPSHRLAFNLTHTHTASSICAAHLSRLPGWPVNLLFITSLTSLSASSKPTTEFAQPRLSRSNGGHPQQEGTNLGAFDLIWLVLPRCEATNLGVFDLWRFALLKRGCANSGGFGARWVCPWFRWIQEGFTVELLRNDSGANFQRNDSDSGPKLRDTSRKSELRTKSQSYSWEDPHSPNQIAKKRAPNGV